MQEPKKEVSGYTLISSEILFYLYQYGPMTTIGLEKYCNANKVSISTRIFELRESGEVYICGKEKTRTCPRAIFDVRRGEG